MRVQDRRLGRRRLNGVLGVAAVVHRLGRDRSNHREPGAQRGGLS